MKPVTSPTRGIAARSHPTPQGLPWLPFSTPRKPMNPTPTKARNEGASKEQLRYWGTLIPFPFALTITPFITRWWGRMPGTLSRRSTPTGEQRNPRYDARGDGLRYHPNPYPQVWIRGKLWHATRLSCRVPIEVLVDTGAAGGNYASRAFTKTAETNVWGGYQSLTQLGKDFFEQPTPEIAASPQWRSLDPA